MPDSIPGGTNRTLFMVFAEIKNPLFVGGGFCARLGADKESDDDLLSQARCLLSLARERFTVLFGMGRGGSTLLWSSDKGVGKEVDLDPAFGLSGWLSFHAALLNATARRKKVLG